MGITKAEWSGEVMEEKTGKSKNESRDVGQAIERGRCPQ